MSTINGTVSSLADHVKRLAPDGSILTVAELLEQMHPMIADAPFKQGNLPTGHLDGVRVGLPSVAWRLLNGGTIPSKSRTAQITEHCGILEAWSEVDVDLASLNGNTAEWRMSEASAFLEAMAQEMGQTLIYGNSGTAPEEFTGLTARFSAISGATNAQNVISGSGSGSDNSSVWLTGWGERSLFAMFPNGSQAGLQHNDYGEQTLENAGGVTGARMRVLQERFQWKAGMFMKDWRQVVRIPNIDISNLVAKSSAADLTELMIKAMHRVWNLSSAKFIFYMNRTCLGMLDIQRRDDVQAGGQLTYEMVDGVSKPFFRGIPIHISDALLETEATVS